MLKNEGNLLGRSTAHAKPPHIGDDENQAQLLKGYCIKLLAFCKPPINRMNGGENPPGIESYYGKTK